MFSLSITATLALALLSNASPVQRLVERHLNPESSTFNHTVEWGPCQAPFSKDFSCGNFTIPLDYHNLAAGSGQLSLIKIFAPGKNRKGTLFLNPGGPVRGPGEGGVEFLGAGGFNDLFFNMTGGDYDLVSWDPRGVGQVTVPGEIDCFNTTSDYDQFWNGTYQNTGGGPEFTRKFTNQSDIKTFYGHLKSSDKAWSQIGQVCHKKHGDALKYIGTAAAARDIAAMAELFDGPGAKVNYYGISYGSAVASAFVNMFPDRVGKVVIDGAVDPNFYFAQPAYTGWADDISSVDAVFYQFLTECAQAGPNGCSFADSHSTADSLLGKFQTLLEAAYQANKADPSLGITSAGIRATIHDELDFPLEWQLAAESLQATFTQLTNPKGNKKASVHTSSSPLHRRQQGPEGDQSIVPTYALNAITCGDSLDNSDVTTKLVFDTLVWNAAGNNVSSIFGPHFFQGSSCHKWPYRAVERYQGPFNKHLSNPVLVIGNEADPITPFTHAQRVADALGDSAFLIKHNGFGVTSLAEPSDCTVAHVRAYFTKNVFPADDTTICDANMPINHFPPRSGGSQSSPPPPTQSTSHKPTGTSDVPKSTSTGDAPSSTGSVPPSRTAV